MGRRLAYDAAKGRLWVVCKKCERWNLSPLEFIKRAAIGGMGGGLLSNWMAGSIVIFGAPVPALIGGGAIAAGIGSYFLHLMKQTRLPHYAIRDQRGEIRRFSAFDAARATLAPAGHAFEWQVRLPYQQVKKTGAVLRALGINEIDTTGKHSTILRDDAAIRALSRILPHANMMGGGQFAFRRAMDVVNDAPNLQYLMHKASVTRSRWQFLQPASPTGETLISGLPAALGLALEMSIHENDERRAMEGELHELERRWKEADAIAKIADEMFLPENFDNTLREFWRDKNRTGSSE